MATHHKASSEALPLEDAISLLVADHVRVAKLFAEFAALKEQGGDDAKSALAAQIVDELTVHTALEEELFYPAVREAIDDDDLMDEALVEHAGAKQLIAQLQAADPDDELYDAKVTVLGEQIEHHVAEEEGNMFAQARGADVDMDALGALMLARKAELLTDRSGQSPLSRAKSVTSAENGQDHDKARDHQADGDLVGKRQSPAGPRPSAKKKAPRKRATSNKRG
jgi:hemerythrin superfamily protein